MGSPPVRRGWWAGWVAVCVGCGTTAPDTLGGCAALSDAAAQETCRFELLEPLVKQPGRLDEASLDDGLKEIGAPASRDLVLLRLAISAPRHAGALCARVTTSGAQEKCTQVLGRPHLATEARGKRPPPGSP